ncbi:hypothetical protein T265_00670 [Opisthorchis viverrini]|uniref:Uncharacterized protein n=1 Tax=Opisthorchis viverrini TaxID=6198 RepID=A0A075A2H9_OPIVI|nr:hypothetical protein T265_00670 [Opisthorchis viverrini]KER33571.1 hypothetical protein T265_00670 [Opisthorchis viverrini]
MRILALASILPRAENIESSATSLFRLYLSGEGQPLNGKGNLGESLDPVYQSIDHSRKQSVSYLQATVSRARLSLLPIDKWPTRRRCCYLLLLLLLIYSAKTCKINSLLVRASYYAEVIGLVVTCAAKFFSTQTIAQGVVLYEEMVKLNVSLLQYLGSIILPSRHAKEEFGRYETCEDFMEEE